MYKTTRSTIFFIIVFIFFPILLWAKQGKAAMNITSGKEDSLWYYLPWIWTIGGAVFILLLVAMIRARQKKYN